MKIDLSGKQALVTGSSSGIGRQIALQLAESGAAVIVHGRNPERTQKTADEIAAVGGVVSTVTGDLMNQDEAEGVVAEVKARGGVDILINNAGGRHGGWAPGWHGVGWQNWLETYKQNVTSTVTLIDGLVPGMAEKGWGRVIQITSAVAIHQPPNFPDYQAAKAAEINLTRSLSRSLAGTGVTSNAISSGIIHTPGSDEEIGMIAKHAGFEGDWQGHEKEIALNVFRQSVGRIGRPQDIAAVVCFLASEQGGFVTGVNLIADGGM